MPSSHSIHSFLIEAIHGALVSLAKLIPFPRAILDLNDPLLGWESIWNWQLVAWLLLLAYRTLSLTDWRGPDRLRMEFLGASPTVYHQPRISNDQFRGQHVGRRTAQLQFEWEFPNVYKGFVNILASFREGNYRDLLFPPTTRRGLRRRNIEVPQMRPPLSTTFSIVRRRPPYSSPQMNAWQGAAALLSISRLGNLQRPTMADQRMTSLANSPLNVLSHSDTAQERPGGATIPSSPASSSSSSAVTVTPPPRRTSIPKGNRSEGLSSSSSSRRTTVPSNPHSLQGSHYSWHSPAATHNTAPFPELHPSFDVLLSAMEKSQV